MALISNKKLIRLDFNELGISRHPSLCCQTFIKWQDVKKRTAWSRTNISYSIQYQRYGTFLAKTNTLYFYSSNSLACVPEQKCHMSLFGHADSNLALDQLSKQRVNLTRAHRGVTATPTGKNVSLIVTKCIRIYSVTQYIALYLFIQILF